MGKVPLYHMRIAKVTASLRGCADSPEPMLFAYLHVGSRPTGKN